MPSTCVRSVSPRNTLPRPTPKRRPLKRPTVTPARRRDPHSARQSRYIDDDLTTPRASSFDVRSEGDHLQTASMTSSIVAESHGSSNTSPTESRIDVANPSDVTSTPKPFRCVTRSAKAKRIRFYRNGDQYYKGLWYALRSDRVRSMKPLMEDLAKAMGDSTALPLGIRHIFSLDGQVRITDIDQFEDGESYVCSSTEAFKSVDYTNAREPFWCFALSRTNRPNDAAMLGLCGTDHVAVEPTHFVFPRIITVIRNGVKPRRVVRHLLNKKTARSFDQVMTDLTCVVKLDSGAIKKLFALGGSAVLTLQDFFREDDVFIAYGNERASADDFYVISEEYKRLYSGGIRRGGRRGTTSRPRVMPARNESLRDDRCGSVVPDELARNLPAELDEKFSVLRLLGDGNTALVYEVMDRRTQEHGALKVIARDSAVGKIALIESELAIMKRIEHPFIVKMFDDWTIDGAYYLSLELVEGGDLFEHLCVVRRVNEHQSARLTKCLVQALAYLHDNSIVHRDVKPENLLLYTGPHGEFELKLADFGLATELPEDGGKLTTICGTPTYVASEVILETGYDEKVDIWATGVILYVMLCGFPPFQSSDGSQDDLFAQIMRGRVSFPSPSWDKISASAKALILLLVNTDKEERFSAHDVLDNQWIKTLSDVPSDFESMAEFIVESRIDADADVEETDREYYMSRRTSMDDLSESGRADSYEFTFSRNYS
uniref:non-specific serine/threonine protein kinase n=1 Tax=Haemonchus contortus TaxID=6289 RepID=A0A7I4YG53_HAECO|nr:Doublecortin and Serine threonine protein kinase-related domain containing protein [Haemonchus contortus]